MSNKLSHASKVNVLIQRALWLNPEVLSLYMKAKVIVLTWVLCEPHPATAKVGPPLPPYIFFHRTVEHKNKETYKTKTMTHPTFYSVELNVIKANDGDGSVV